MADIEWIDPDGVTTVLSADGTRAVQWNVTGLLSPPTRFDEDGVPEMSGARLRSVQHEVREVFLPVWVKGTSAADLRVQVRSLVSSLNPLRGDGRLRVTSPIGDQRELVCRVSSGLEGVERLGDTTGIWMQQLPLMFRVWDPYWQDISDTASGPWIAGMAPASFFPLFPLRLSSSEIFAAVAITNSGDVDAWPVWTVMGPGSGISLQNLTTGYTLLLNATLSSGESVTIDTRPGVKAVTKSDGTNLYPNLSATSSLWPLQRGVNSVQVSMGGSTSVTSVTMRHRNKYLAV